MKPGTRITKNNLPKQNGRPQLWITVSDKERLTKIRIVYPNGYCEYMIEDLSYPGIDLAFTARYTKIYWEKSCFADSARPRKCRYEINSLQFLRTARDCSCWDRGRRTYFGGYL